MVFNKAGDLKCNNDRFASGLSMHIRLRFNVEAVCPKKYRSLYQIIIVALSIPKLLTMKQTLSILLAAFICISGCTDPDLNDFYRSNEPKRILVDASHDGGGWWFPQSPLTGFSSDQPRQGKALADLLKAMGFIVDELPRGILITDSILRRYDKVIRAGKYEPYLPSELVAYDNFLNRKTSLLLISEYLRPTSQIDQLAERIGVQFRGVYYDSVDHFSAHSITAGARPFYYNAGSAVINSNSPAITVLGRIGGPSGLPVMGILQHPQAKIFFIGEINGLHTVPQPFTSQLFKWLFN